MALNATKMQQKAIDAKGNVLVAAAAGSGKTAVLVERVVKMLLDKENPVSADRLLIVTFTNAAANEMRTRIEARLYEEYIKNPEDTLLIEQRQLISGADISTIDSFCINLVRDNFEKCGVAPDFKVGNRARLNEISNMVMAQVLEQQFRDNSPAFRKLLELTGCENNEQNLIEAITDIYTFSRQLPFPEDFILSLKKPYTMPFNSEHPWYKWAFEYAMATLKNIKSDVEIFTNLAVKIEINADSYIVYAEKTALLIDELEKAAQSLDFDSFKELLSMSNLGSLPSAKDKSDPYVKAVKEIKKKISDALKVLSLVFRDSKEQNNALLSRLKAPIELLCDLINDYSNRLFDEFNADGNFDFYNTEQLALNLLCEKDKKGEIVLKNDADYLSSRYDEVLVDEFQDVNDLQNLLFYALSNREKKLFVVGDLKQSIYGFRGSNPKNFLDKKNRYTNIEQITDNSEPKKIILADNFRSRKGVCDYVNYFFSKTLNGELGGFVYNSEEYLNPAAVFPENGDISAKTLFIDMAGNDNETEILSCEAKTVARYIKETVDSKKPLIRVDKQTLRAAQYGDFAILLNALSGKGEAIAEVLKSYDIPVSLSGGAYAKTPEISLMLALLRVIDNPKSDAELLSVMLSPIFGFSVEEMAQIRAENKTGDIYSCIISAAESGNKKAQDFKTRLSDFRNKAAVLPLDSLVNNLLISSGILDYMSALEGGEARRNNLLSLIRFAKDYGKGNFSSLSGFIKYIKTAPEETFKNTAKADNNAVKIMTMHSSKGLQFPICIIAGNYSAFNNSDLVGRMLFSAKGGICFRYFDEDEGCDIRTLGHLLTSKAAAVNTVEEKMRLLYVAMTRAEDILVNVISLKNAEKTVNRVAINTASGIKGAWLKSTNNINDWLIAATLLHPDGNRLRDICEIEFAPVNTDSRFEFIEYKDEFEASNSLKVCQSDDVGDDELKKKIAENLSYTYPFEALKSIAAKASVSAIANKAENAKYGFTSRPSFMMNSGLTATERGTATHKIMQFIDISEMPDVKTEIERLTEYGFISESEALAVDKTAIEGFFKSDLFARILSSKNVKREMKFLTEMPASRLNQELDESIANTPVIIQGAVDLCFEEEDGLVVLDFKTDRVNEEGELALAYSEQLNIYAKACAKIFNKPVKEKMIYSFSLRRQIIL